MLVCLMLVFVFTLSGCSNNSTELKVSALTHFNKGNALLKQNRLKPAAEEFKRAIKLDPNQDRFYYNLGLTFYSLHLFDLAIQEYWNAIELNPSFEEAWYNLALAFEKVDDTEKAFMAYEKYQKISQKKNSVKVESKPKPAQGATQKNQ